MLDVASVAFEWMAAHESFVRQWSNRLGLKKNQFVDLVGFLAAIHDLGKFAADFQFKVPELAERFTERRSFPFIGSSHPASGFWLWDNWLRKRFWKHLNGLADADRRILQRTIRPLLTAAFGHHGKPVKAESLVHETAIYDERSRKAAEQLMDDLVCLFPGCVEALEVWGADKTVRAQVAAFSFPLSGLIVLSDWIGSSTDDFPLAYAFDQRVEETLDVKITFRRARALAKAALQRHGLLSAPVRLLQDPWSELFPTFSGFEPTPLQQAILNIEPDGNPALYIIEDIAGSGKTEAALLLTAKLLKDEGAEGFYFAMPTMATSNGLYARLASIYRHFYQEDGVPSLILAHSRKDLNQDFQRSLLPRAQTETDVSLEDAHNDQLSTRAACNEWFSDRSRKALLAQVGVGSIDQALLAVLYSKHNTLRMFGLSRKILIVDEVHAYDSYMQELLDTLIRLQAQQGRSVILLSATLPLAMKKRLASSYLQGFRCEGTSRNPEVLSDSAYPAVTVVSEARSRSIAVEPSARHCRSVGVEFLFTEDGDINVPVQKLVGIAESGRCAVWIRNTVADVQDAYDRLRGQIDDAKLMVFHSRFAAGHRSDIETQVLELFGKESGQAERRGRILLATQVVEQSLDLDFDEMITDLCPIDLIIQRVGRLRRHSRDEAGNRSADGDRRGEATLFVFSPEPDSIPDENTEESWYRRCFGRGAKVYADHAILWRTANILKRQGRIDIPKTLRHLIEHAYGETPAPKRLPRSTPELDEFRAQTKALVLCNGYVAEYDASPWRDDDAPTRLTGDTRTYRLCVLDGEEIRPLVPDPEGSFSLSEVKFWPISINVAPGLKTRLEHMEHHLADQGRGGVLLPFRKVGTGIYRCAAEFGQGRSLFYYEKIGLRFEKS